jgi:hypothetical protein
MWSILICRALRRGGRAEDNREERESAQRVRAAKIKLESVAYFLSPKKTASEHHLYRAIHHNFTTKTPRSAPRISRKPLIKCQFTMTEKISRHKPIFPSLQTAKSRDRSRLFGLQNQLNYALTEFSALAVAAAAAASRSFSAFSAFLAAAEFWPSSAASVSVVKDSITSPTRMSL